MESKKILFIVNNLGVGGSERVVVDDINEMRRQGVDVFLVTLRPEPQKSFLSGLRLPQEKIQCVGFKGLLNISSWLKLLRAIRVIKPDLVITQLWFDNTVGRIAARLAGVRRVISFEQNVYDTVKTRKMFFVDWCLQFLSTKIIAVSEAVKKSLIRHHIKESKIVVLHNSIDLSAFSSAVSRSKLRSELKNEYGIPESAFLYLFIGRLIHQKAVDVLIESFKTVAPESFLLIVGQGKDREPLESQVKANGVEKRVIFTGVRNDIPQLLFAADCFVLPSRYEGLPLVLTEALAAGQAIIVSDFESASEIITPEKNGLIVPRENVQALAEAMNRVKNDNALRSHLAEQARKSAQNFSISSHVHAILGFLKFHEL